YWRAPVRARRRTGKGRRTPACEGEDRVAERRAEAGGSRGARGPEGDGAASRSGPAAPPTRRPPGGLPGPEHRRGGTRGPRRAGRGRRRGPAPAAPLPAAGRRGDRLDERAAAGRPGPADRRGTPRHGTAARLSRWRRPAAVPAGAVSVV